MFYDDHQELELRFGDILKGFVCAVPEIEEPITDAGKHKYKVNVHLPDLCVVLSPCCSINPSNGVIVLSPLITIFDRFYSNPYLKEDLTRINRKMTSQQALPPEAWKKMPAQEKAEREAEGIVYTFIEMFVYEKHNALPVYELSISKKEKISINYYMIDFRKAFTIECKALQSGREKLSHAKMLQLSPKTREELRNKIAFYYGRPTKEDIALLG